jgi:hypothetical protein
MNNDEFLAAVNNSENGWRDGDNEDEMLTFL